jgi:hypothetical protein
MGNNSVQAISNTDFIHLSSKTQLSNLKTRAIRSGAWFKALQRIDRVLFDLTLKVVDKIRSAKLAKSMLTLIRKLNEALISDFSNLLRKIGLLLARKVGFTAQKLGITSASDWLLDSSFALFLAVMHINMLM